MKKQNLISISIAAVILLALTAFGSVWDLAIANAVYIGQTPRENPFGILFSYIGIIPTFVGWSFLGASILCLSQKQVESPRKRRWLSVFAVLLFLLSFFYFCNTLYLSNANAFKVPAVAAYSIGLAVILAAAYAGYRLSKRSHDSELLRKALFLAAVSLLTLLMVSIAKELMCRPRFRWVLAMDNTDFFRNWWQSGRALRESLGGQAVTDEFASLPSGHSAYAMFAVFLFPALADYIRGLKAWKPCLFALGFVWWGATALSRMTVGAHYLTDVTIAGLVTLLAYGMAWTVRQLYAREHR